MPISLNNNVRSFQFINFVILIWYFYFYFLKKFMYMLMLLNPRIFLILFCKKKKIFIILFLYTLGNYYCMLWGMQRYGFKREMVKERHWYVVSMYSKSPLKRSACTVGSISLCCQIAQPIELALHTLMVFALFLPILSLSLSLTYTEKAANQIQ